MPSADLRSNTAIAVLSGCGMAVGWYAVSSVMVPGWAGTLTPALGAIALAGVVPTLILKDPAQENTPQPCPEMAQRLEALNKHACINIVNEKDELTEVNDKLLGITGYSRGELIGQPIKFLCDASVYEVAADIRSHLERGETWEGETPLRRKDGSTLYTQSTVTPLFDEAGNWVGSISARTDVTRTNELISERHTAQTLYELCDDIWIIDSETENFSYMNRAAKGRLNISGEGYRNKSLGEFSRDCDLDEVLEACRALRGKGEVSTQFMGVSADVSIKSLPGAKGAGRYLILFNDISDRIEQEKRKTEFISTVSHELRSPLTSIKGAMGLLLSRSAGDLPDKALALLEIARRNADRLVLIINDILDLDKISNGQLEFDIQDVDLAELMTETDQANAMLQQRFGVQVELIGTQIPVNFRTDPKRFLIVLPIMTRATSAAPDRKGQR